MVSSHFRKRSQSTDSPTVKGQVSPKDGRRLVQVISTIAFAIVPNMTPRPALGRPDLQIMKDFFILALCSAFCTPTFAQPLIDFCLGREQALQNYRVEYRVTTVSPNDIPEYIKALNVSEDKSFLDSPLLVGESTRIVNSILNVGWTSETTFLRDGQPIDVLYERSGPNNPLIKDSIVSFSDRDDVQVHNNTTSIAWNHPLLGLGVGRIVEPEVKVVSDGRIIEGKDQDGRLLRFHFEGDSRYPDRLVVEQSATEPIYEYENWSGGTAAFPRHIRVSYKGREDSRVEITIEKLEIGKAILPKQDEEAWFRPGYDFHDSRLGQTVVYTYDELLKLNGGSTELSAAKLLDFTRQRIDGSIIGVYDRAIAKSELAERKNRGNQQTYILWITAILVLAGVAAYWLKRRKVR